MKVSYETGFQVKGLDATQLLQLVGETSESDAAGVFSLLEAIDAEESGEKPDAEGTTGELILQDNRDLRIENKRLIAELAAAKAELEKLVNETIK